MKTYSTSEQTLPDQVQAGFKAAVAMLPQAHYAAGEVVLMNGSKSGRLLILKSGTVAILKNGVEIAKVAEPGALVGEISALLDEPHSADVRALEDTQFYVADAALFVNDPIWVHNMAKILARRLVAADEALIELKSHVHENHAVGALSHLVGRVEQALIGSLDHRFRMALDAIADAKAMEAKARNQWPALGK